MKQMTDWRTQSAPHITWLGDGFTCQRNHALGDGLAINDGALNRPGRADVLHQHANVRRASAVRHFHTGKNFGELFGTARRILGGNDANLEIALTAQRLLQSGDGFRFVIFDAN